MNNMNLAQQTIPIKQGLPGVGGVPDTWQSQEPVPVGCHHLHLLHLHTGVWVISEQPQMSNNILYLHLQIGKARAIRVYFIELVHFSESFRVEAKRLQLFHLLESPWVPLSQGDGGMVEHRTKSQIGEADRVS